MITQLDLGGIAVDVILKDIKNVHLSVYPPTGRVRISAPLRMSAQNIRAFAISKLAWIRRHQRKLDAQIRETPRDYIDRESHYVRGKRYLLEVLAVDAPPRVELGPRKLRLLARSELDAEARGQVLAEWYRGQLRAALPPLIAKWSSLMEVSPSGFSIRKMRTKWGSCNTTTGRLLFNTDLARLPPACLEYVVVHEMLHLIVRRHDKKFYQLMDHYVPGWPHVRQTLNDSPLFQRKVANKCVEPI
jgi:predicted metal-dependent hydrolase